MPATPDYTLIQLMRGGKYAVETAIPESGEPLLELDSGTLYYGNGKDIRGIPLNSVTAVKLETPVNLDDLTTWGRYYLEGKVQNLPVGLELYAKIFLVVEGSTATDAKSISQTIRVLEGDARDQTFVRSSLDSGNSWTSWKTVSGSTLFFDADGGGTVDKNPAAPLSEYVLSSLNYIQSISGGPAGTDGKSGFLLVYRKDLESPYIYQELILSNPDENGGKIYCRLSATNNQDWNSPGYTWREISYVAATTSRAGVVKLSSAVNSTSETLAATPKAVKTAYDKGVEALNKAVSAYDLAETASEAATTHASTSVYGVTKLSSATNSTSEALAATPKAVKTAYDKGVEALNKATDAYTLAESASTAATTHASTSVYGVTKLSSATNSTSEALAATPKAVKTAYDKAVDAYNKATTADGKKWIKYSSTDTTTVPSDLPDGGFLIIT